MSTLNARNLTQRSDKRSYKSMKSLLNIVFIFIHRYMYEKLRPWALINGIQMHIKELNIFLNAQFLGPLAKNYI